MKNKGKMSAERIMGRRYRLGRRLGSGSFGEVWHGTDITTGKHLDFDFRKGSMCSDFCV